LKAGAGLGRGNVGRGQEKSLKTVQNRKDPEDEGKDELRAEASDQRRQENRRNDKEASGEW